jgi:hypothetical protein
MNRTIWLVVALSIAVPCGAVAQGAAKPADKTTEKKPAPGKPSEQSATDKKAAAAKSTEKKPADAAAEKSASEKTTLKPRAKKQEPTGPSPALRSHARRTKSTYMYAVESCERPGGSCDTALRDDAEKRFLDACGACAPSERCQAERDAIRTGAGQTKSDPCAP